MSDNTTLNAGTGGDSIRAVAKTATGAKTQAIVLDIGGGMDASPEVILAAGQALMAASISVTLASDQGPIETNISAAPSGLTPVVGSFSATGNSASFAPLSGRPFNISLWGTFAASCALQRSFDGSTWLPITASGAPVMNFAGPVSEQWGESEVGVQYRLACTVTSGAVNFRISQ